MPEEKIEALEKEEQMPKTLEELFISEHLEIKNELKSTKEELGSAKRALSTVTKELKLLKSIIAKHAEPITVAEDGHIAGGSISMYIYDSSWEQEKNPGLKDEIAYLKTIIPVVEPSEEKEEDKKDDD